MSTRRSGMGGFFRELEHEWSCDKASDVAGNLAFSAVLSLFPFLLFAVALAGLLLDPTQVTALVGRLSAVAPADAVSILGRQLDALARSDNAGVLTVGAAGAIWAASGGVAALMSALNTAYDVEETRSFWKRRGLAIAVTLVGAVLSVVAAVVAIAAPAVARALGEPFVTVAAWLRLPVAAVLMAAVLAVLYHVLPNVKLPLRWITPGAVIAVVGWLLASWGFSAYVKSFGRYNAVYGALGGIIVFLLWLWISALAVMLGAEINALIIKRAHRVEPGRAPRREPRPEPRPARAPAGAAPLTSDRPRARS